MKYRRPIAFLILMIFFPLTMWLLWHAKPVRVQNILVMDKTVINNKFQEHLSLFWVLNNENYQPTSKRRYNPQNDYYGMFPNGRGTYSVKDFENFSFNELDSLSNIYSVTYYTDLYGVYSDDWIEEYRPYLSKKDLNAQGGVNRIYGGFTNNDLLFLKMMKQKERLIIAEFNILPASQSQEIRTTFENEFNVHWTGWVGRYFDNLDTLVNKELPRWIIKNYKAANCGTWPFKNSGIVFVNGDIVVILENNIHLDFEVPLIRTKKKFQKRYSITPEIKYPFWFEIVEAKHQNSVISNYHIMITHKGDSLLKARGIPSVFPATICHTDGYTFYYFAGDFSDNPIYIMTSYFRYIHLLSPILYSDELIEREGFFWKYYRPMVKTILDEHYKSVHKNE